MLLKRQRIQHTLRIARFLTCSSRHRRASNPEVHLFSHNWTSTPQMMQICLVSNRGRRFWRSCRRRHRPRSTMRHQTRLLIALARISPKSLQTPSRWLRPNDLIQLDSSSPCPSQRRNFTCFACLAIVVWLRRNYRIMVLLSTKQETSIQEGSTIGRHERSQERHEQPHCTLGWHRFAVRRMLRGLHRRLV